MLESIGTGSLVGALVVALGLFVRALVSGQSDAAKRYEAEIQRLHEERKLERERLIREAEYWRERYMAIVNKS